MDNVPLKYLKLKPILFWNEGNAKINPSRMSSLRNIVCNNSFWNKKSKPIQQCKISSFTKQKQLIMFENLILFEGNTLIKKLILFEEGAISVW